MKRLSACLITFNEEHNLPRALASHAGIADEIVVVDSGSTDRTAEIAKAHGVSFFERPFNNHADQKNYAASCARNNWIFLLGADEGLSRDLRNSLLEWKGARAGMCSLRNGAAHLVPRRVDPAFTMVCRFSAKSLPQRQSELFGDDPFGAAFRRKSRPSERSFAALHDPHIRGS